MQRERLSIQNHYEINQEEGTAYCYVGDKGCFYFDIDDYEKVSKYQWAINKLGYARCSMSKNGKRISFYVHNLILDFAYSKSGEIDHIDGNPRNNKRDNLRIATHMQNMKNMKMSKANKTGHKGVGQRENGRWFAQITVNRKHMYIGTYDTYEDAVVAREEAEKKYFGEWARKL